MLNSTLINLGKGISNISKMLNRGNGSTWPGHIALKANKNFISDILRNSETKTIIIAGTNGKTTTASLIRTGLEKNGYTTFQNESGANLLNGIASTILLNTNNKDHLSQDYAIFEVDENALPLVLEQIAPDYLVLLNLFRDQLDRYGEINTIAGKWDNAIEKLPDKTKLIFNADDPQIAFLGRNNPGTQYFSLANEKTDKQSAADSLSCPKCGTKLKFSNITFSHLGEWNCPSCGLRRPKAQLSLFSTYPLAGMYNKYNSNAAVLTLKEIGLQDGQIKKSFESFVPAFGRQEIIEYQDKKVQLFLSKNPTSFNQSYKTIQELHASTLLIVLNDRIPDGRDISWIWDTELPDIEKFKTIILSGDRVYDIALRVKYSGCKKFKTFEQLKEAIDFGIDLVQKNETFYILPTYSAMLDVRKIVTGKKIL